MQREQCVQIIDTQQENSASRVAAGLVNPVTGQRLVKAADVTTCLPVAMNCYKHLQREFGEVFYHPKMMLRLFASPADKDRYLNRSREQSYQAFLGEEFAAGGSGQPISSKAGGFVQLQTGYLDIPRLLKALRNYFIDKNVLLDARFDYQDVELADGIVRWQGQQYNRVIFCEGAQAIDNPWFRWLPFQLSKGEIITVRSSCTLPDAIINNGIWVLPYKSNIARAGATYQWEWLDEKPSQDAKDQLLTAFRHIIGDTSEVDVIEHRAGIRPTTRDKSPFLGIHPDHPALYILNGFGSKGALMIPYYSECLSNFFLTGQTLPGNADIARFSRGNSLVTIARRYLSEHIQRGDIVIDATTGNGHDTEFAARCVGPQGRVYGFDIQQQAIDNTQQRIIRSGFQKRVTLIKAGHEQMKHCVPDDVRGMISTIIFNLGYLPGDNKQVATQRYTTITALHQALALIKIDGMVCIVAYRGHDSGVQEAEVLQQWITNLNSQDYQVIVIDPNRESNSPFLVMIYKRA